MTQRIRDRLTGTGNNLDMDNEILVRAIREGEYIDQFTTVHTTPEQAKAALQRLPKCMQNKRKES